MTVYDVTAQFSTDGNTAVLANTYPGGGNVSVRGMLLAVVYDDGVTAPHTILMNEGFDLLYGGAAQSTTPEQATAYAPFSAVKSGATGARLVTVAPGAGPTEGDLLFNDETFQNVWNYTGATQIGRRPRRDGTPRRREPGRFRATPTTWRPPRPSWSSPPPAGSIASPRRPRRRGWLDGERPGGHEPPPNVPAGAHVVTLKRDGYADA